MQKNVAVKITTGVDVHPLFTYGSLMCRDIMHTVVSHCHVLGSAVLQDYRCFIVRNETYPGIIPCLGHQTNGIVYSDITEANLAKLDKFEGSMYERRLVNVTLISGDVKSVFTYVIKPEYEALLETTPWDFNEFFKHGKKSFEAKYVGFENIRN
ncbi:gamma-glutamylcyclotransferase [candidate division KSB1 bacterium]|nr:gamma-glutamylcyclotransferase [candidate division KSB1 bacterium]